MMQRELMITEDGSHTIYLPALNEHYHSVHGAIQESMHIYIGQGLQQCSSEQITILEIGFGTGLNAFLSFCYAQEKNIGINYISLEKYPLREEEYGKLNYTDTVFQEYSTIFLKMHEADWNTKVEIAPGFTLLKIEADLLTFDLKSLPPIDLVYYDAFAPSKQPELWSDQLLYEVAQTTRKGGIWVTYCAKGTVRRAMISAGFEMERISGPAGKKEILRGKKKI